MNFSITNRFEENYVNPRADWVNRPITAAHLFTRFILISSDN